MSINETVLEMHFHQALIDTFINTLGLGKGKFNFYKYSTQKECFVGFDQAFVQTDLSESALFEILRDSAKNQGYNLSNFFIGLFLQYKVVKILQKRSRITPATVRSAPHFRVSLDTKKNANTGFSQHELLFKLNKNSGALVYYACPMMFDQSDLYTMKPNLEKLRLADVSACPSIYSDNDSHFIYYQEQNSPPIWCSEPVQGTSVTSEELVGKIGEQITNDNFFGLQMNLLNVLQSPVEENRKEKYLELVSDSMTIIHYTEDKEPNKTFHTAPLRSTRTR